MKTKIQHAFLLIIQWLNHLTAWWHFREEDYSHQFIFFVCDFYEVKIIKIVNIILKIY